MVDAPSRTLQDLVGHVGQYPEEAFIFVREGLSHAAERVHGPETDAHRTLHQFLSENDVDWDQLIVSYHAHKLPPPIMETIAEAGGCEKLNRHITGRQLCWGLRDLALGRWGMLARTVLESWNIRGTQDFGRIVFGFIDLEMMRKQAEDRVEDFEEVFDFRDAFDRAFRDGRLPGTATDS